MQRLLEQADLVLTVDGVALGADDYALALLRESGVRVFFWEWELSRVTIEGRYRPFRQSRRRCGSLPTAGGPYPIASSVVYANSFPKQGCSRRFLRGYVTCGPQGWEAPLLSGQKSSILRSLINWNGPIGLSAGHLPLQPASRMQRQLD